MAKKMLIDATHPEETRVVVVDGNKVDDFDFESVNKKQLAGNIYLAKVTRVEPSLQAAFVDYGGNRHGFLSFAEIHPDYYQIPVADREALIAEEAALVRRENGNGGGSQNGSQDEDEGRRGRGRRGRRKSDRQGGEEQAVAEDLDADGAVEAEAASDGGDEGRAEGGKGRSRGRRGRGRRKSGDSASDDGGIAGFDVIDPEGGGLDGAPEPQEVAAAPSEPASEVSPDEGPEAVDEATTESAAEGSVTAAVAEVPASEEPSEEAAPEHESPLETVPDGEGADADAELEPPVATAEPETPEGIVAEPEAGAAEEVDPEPPVGPRSMAESAGLDDEDDVVRGDVPASDAASSDAPAAEDGAETGSDAEVEKPKPKRRAPRRKPAPKTEGASEAPAEEGAAAAEKPAEKPRRRRRKAEPEEAAASAETPIVETPTPETSAAASESAEDAPTPENPAVDVVSAEATAETITAEAPTDTEDATAAGEAPLGEAAEASEDTAASAADADETILADREAPTPEDPSEGGSPAKPRRGRRGDGSAKRRRDRKAETDEAEPETAREMPGDEDGAEPSEDGEGDEREAPEQVGAEDLREEELAARAIRRRRYKIQDVIKSRQIMLVQVVKEERGTKGAALTTYLSLAGRYCVLMPNTARGGGISRKITNAPDRKRLREIVGELEVPEGMGLIVRTAGAERTRAEIKRDYEFLLRQWEQIRELTLRSSAPCLIYEEGSLIKRSIRDIYNKDIDAVLVEGEAGYREAKDYMKMLMPSHAKNVQQYQDQIPLFIRYQVESYLNGMFSPVVQLKSGGYIVIGITEALVAIDVNSGRSTKEGSIEETATKTNLEAADEVARQLRLRDLAGLIVIDFIDMDEGRNNRAVEKRMKERLKTDRARIQVGRISAFGLMEMSRQRLRPGMLEATTKPCPHCHGTGFIRSDESLALGILREIEEEGVKGRASELVATMPVDIANFIVNSKRAHLAQIEERYSIGIQLLGDPAMVSPEFRIDRVKGSEGRPPIAPPREAVSASGSSTLIDDAEVVEERRGRSERPNRSEEEDEPLRNGRADREDDGERARGDDDNGSGKKRRRGKRGGRRRRGGEDRRDDQQAEGSAEVDADTVSESDDAVGTETAPAAIEPEVAAEAHERAGDQAPQAIEDAAADEPSAAGDRGDGSPSAEPTGEPMEPEAASEVAPEVASAPETDPEPDVIPKVVEEEAPAAEASPDVPLEVAAAEAGRVAAGVAEAPPAEPEDEAKPKRRGWWSFRR